MAEQLAVPNTKAVMEAVQAARRSPCVKSKRGAAIFHPFTGAVGVSAYNSRPDLQCDHLCAPIKGDSIIEQATSGGSPSRCARMCLHAEQRAIRGALIAEARSQFVADGDFAFALTDCELIHVKIDNFTGELVPSGPPSCIWCAKEIADVCLHGVWLYEVDAFEEPHEPKWFFYPTKMFWERTLEECKLT